MRRPLFMVCLCLVAAVAVWLSLYDFLGMGGEQSNVYLPDDGEVITITGRVYRKDNGVYNTQTFRLKSVIQSEASYAATSQQSIPINDNLICESEELADIRVGSTVMLRGTFEHFSAATNPGEFDAADYYHTQNICGKLTDITVLAVSNDYSEVNEMLYQLRCYFKNRLYRVFPQKEASIITAMLLGDKEELDSGIKELYMQNGIVHILSISGLHITMIGMGIYKMLRRIGVPVWMAAVCGGIVLCLYGVMTGMSLSACRAIGMYLIRMLAVVVGRSYDMLTALGVMAVILVCQNPDDLKNAGFLLSFGSILGIGLLYPALLPDEKKVNSKWTGLFQTIVAGSSITLFTLPIQLWFYYEVPTYSILTNLLLLPFMSVLMLTGLMAMLLPGVGMVGTVTCLILQGYEWVCKGFNLLPFHTWNPGKPSGWQVAGYYLILFVLILVKFRKRWTKMPFLLILSVMILSLRIRTGSTVTFLDVGQGDGIVVETASGEVYLFDCGSSSRKQVGKYVLLPFLKYRGIQHINAVFVSHADEDHCSGIEELFELGGTEGITVGQLVLPKLSEEMQKEELASLIQIAEESKQETPIQISYIETGDYFATERAEFWCLHPPGGYETADSNTYSQCFYIELGGMSLLLTGDVEGEGEEIFLQELENRDIDNVTVLKVAHHGSRNSTNERFLAKINPQIAIISCGRDNSYGHPHEELLERLEYADTVILRTDESGAVMLQSGKDRVRIQSILPRSSYHSFGRF